MTTATQATDVKQSQPYSVGPPVFNRMDMDALAKFEPKSDFGKALKEIVSQTDAYLVEMTAISGFVNGLADANLSDLPFTKVPPGVNSSLGQLKSAYESFKTNFGTFKSNAIEWYHNTGNDQNIIERMNDLTGSVGLVLTSIQSNIELLEGLDGDKKSPVYQKTVKSTTKDIKAEVSKIQALITKLKGLGTNLSNDASTVVNAAQSGILKQLVAAYQQDAAKTQQAIDTLNQAISADNDRITKLQAAKDAAIALIAIGAVNFWNPSGWTALAVGTKAENLAIEQINVVSGEVASDTTKVDTYGNWKSANQQAAMTVAALSHQLGQFAAMNSSAQSELNKLETLFTQVDTYLDSISTDVVQGDLSSAKKTLKKAVALDSALSDISAYIWPSPRKLSFPKSFAALGNDIYAVALSGALYHLASGTSSWTAINKTALSCVGWYNDQGVADALVVIDGAPLKASDAGTANNSSFYVKKYDLSSKDWSTLTDFPVTNIAKSVATSQFTYKPFGQYNGNMNIGFATSGVWNSVSGLPSGDIASQTAFTWDGNVYALGTNSKIVYYLYGSMQWAPVASFTVQQIWANGDYLAILDTDNNAYCYKFGSPLSSHLGNVAQLAQLSTGGQYCIDTNNNLCVYQSSPQKWVQLQSDAVGVFASETDQVYYVSGSGNMYSLDSNNNRTLLPALPKS